MNERLIAKYKEFIELAKTGKKFTIDGWPDQVFRIAQDEFQAKPNGVKNSWMTCGVTVNGLLRLKFIYEPWRPALHETFFFWARYNNGWVVDCQCFLPDEHTIALIEMGNCFKTATECEARLDVRDKLNKQYNEYFSQGTEDDK